MSKQPPVPPANRSSKGPGGAASGKGETKGRGAPPDNLAEQDRQGDIKQNTTNQGYQQDR